MLGRGFILKAGHLGLNHVFSQDRLCCNPEDGFEGSRTEPFPPMTGMKDDVAPLGSRQ
jgi:hypothetical protein